ncbi:MAG: ATP-binding protein, partial [Dehalococcoidales bacterium]|nr:ATP-binding protein [Dehalococcoidales bacterium]
FSNGDGGSILIGVKDDSEVLGLDSDYESLQGSRDKFELHLRNIIKENFDTTFSFNHLNISFPVIADHEICKIDVQRANKPIYIDTTDSQGNKTAKLYVRIGNSSQEIPLRDIATYIESRFNHRS